jgi:hypothetical protein
MLGKASLVAGLAAGYVLGTRDGRARYEQIKVQATRLWHDPKVQQKATQAQEMAKQNAPKIQEKVSGAAHKAGSKVQARRSPEVKPSGSQPTVPYQRTTTVGELHD